jgi:hypothetical protein
MNAWDEWTSARFAHTVDECTFISEVVDVG